MQLLLSAVPPAPRLLCGAGRVEGARTTTGMDGCKTGDRGGQGQSPAWVLSPMGKQPWKGARRTPRPSVCPPPEPEHPNGDASSCTEPG